MTTSRISPQERLLQDQVNAVIPGVYEQLENLPSSDHEPACKILTIIIGFCCTAQHMGGIQAGRNAFKRLPSKWVSSNLPLIIGESINLADSWEYRRLLELLSEENPHLFNYYRIVGLESKDPEIHEVSIDFAKSK